MFKRKRREKSSARNPDPPAYRSLACDSSCTKSGRKHSNTSSLKPAAVITDRKLSTDDTLSTVLVAFGQYAGMSHVDSGSGSESTTA